MMKMKMRMMNSRYDIYNPFDLLLLIVLLKDGAFGQAFMLQCNMINNNFWNIDGIPQLSGIDLIYLLSLFTESFV
jgi:hypothetical protein